ncbi:unnamed protein product [Rhodiola kirilowii]
MSQIATTVSELKNDPGRLPSQTIQNPRGNVNAVTLRSGRGAPSVPRPSEDSSPPAAKDETTGPGTLGSSGQGTFGSDPTLSGQDALGLSLASAADVPRAGPMLATNVSRPDPVPVTENSNVRAPLPFPVQVRDPKQYVMDKEVWELFSKVEINIPLLKAIKQIPRYSKFFKELCTNRRRGTQPDQELMSRNVSAVIQRKVPPKCGDPGTYTIPCTIGNIRIENCMLDLGASINVLPYSIYSCLRIGPLEPARLTI